MVLSFPDPTSGVITFSPSGTALGPTTDRHQFLLTPEGLGATAFVSNPPHMSYKLGRAYEVMAERSVGVVLYFTHDKLIRAEFYLIAGTGLSWADWSEADEISKKDTLTALVDRIYAATPPLRFDWGILECTFDARAGSSQVIASFAPTRGAL